MPLRAIDRKWDYGQHLAELETKVAFTLRWTGGHLVYRLPGSSRFAFLGVARVHHCESFGRYPWRVSLREAGGETWRVVDEYPTFREADAAAKRHVRSRAVAVGEEDDWCASAQKISVP